MPFVDERDALNALAVDLRREAAQHGAGPWRIPLVGDPAMRVVLIGWPPGFATIPHHHPYGPETFEVIEGTLGFRLDDHPEVEAPPGTFLLARRGQVHGLRVLGDGPLVIAASVGPNVASPDETIERPDLWPDWLPAEA